MQDSLHHQPCSRSSNGRRRAAALSLALLALLAPHAARGQSLFPERYVACREEQDVPPAAQAERPRRAPADTLVPIGRKPAPAPLAVAPLVVIDVATTQPVPARRAAPSPASPAPPEPLRLVPSGGNDYKCLGYARGKAGILRVIGAPPGTRWYGHAAGEGYRLDNMRAAGAFDLRESMGLLRRELERPEPPGPTDWRTFEALDLKLMAARALADLGDRDSAGRVLALLRAREGKDTPYVWSEALEPLGRLDPELGQAYAVEVLDRVADRGRQGAADDFLVREVLPYITRPSAEARAALGRLSVPLERLSSDGARHDACAILAARLRAGDDELRRELRPELATDLRTGRAVHCYSELIGLVFPGEEPDEVEALTHRWRYDEIVGLVARMRARETAGQSDPRFAAARRTLRSWLAARSVSPEIAGGQDDRRYQPVTRAKHLLAQALLDDERARAALDLLVEDPADDGVAPWAAARLMLQLGLSGAADRAAARLRLATTRLTDRHEARSTPQRGLVLVTDHVLVIDELARLGDPRFALGLLDRERSAREAALHQLARLRPEATCAVVGEAASAAQADAIDDAFWALAVLGRACAPTMRALATDDSARPEVRAVALEVLAMLRDATVPELAPRIAQHARARAAVKRAWIILGARE